MASSRVACLPSFLRIGNAVIDQHAITGIRTGSESQPYLVYDWQLALPARKSPN